MRQSFYVYVLSGFLLTCGLSKAGPGDRAVKPKLKQKNISRKMMLSPGNLHEVRYLFEAGAYYGLDFFNTHGGKQLPLGFSGLQAQLKYGKIMLSGDFQHFNRLIDDAQFMPSFFNNTYKISFGGKAALSLGYSDNTWVSSFDGGRPAEGEAKTKLIGSSGREIFVPFGLLKYKAPSYILGYQFTIAEEILGSNQTHNFDDYDGKHNSKVNSCLIVSAAIDVMYAPEAKTDSTLIYSPYGYFVPTRYKIETPMVTRQFGVQMRMLISTPYAIGLFMNIGILPGVTAKYSDNPKNICAGVGVLINFNKVKLR